MDCSTLSPDSGTRHRSPEVSSTTFDAQPPDLPPAALMDVGFATFRSLARCRRPLHPVLVHRLAPLLHASFRPRLATTPLRFAITSPPSGCEEDFHLPAVEHARHTKTGQPRGCPTTPTVQNDYLFSTKCPRRFCCQQDSFDSVQNGFSIPKLTVLIRSAGTPAATNAFLTALARLSPKARLY